MTIQVAITHTQESYDKDIIVQTKSNGVVTNQQRIKPGNTGHHFYVYANQSLEVIEAEPEQD